MCKELSFIQCSKGFHKNEQTNRKNCIVIHIRIKQLWTEQAHYFEHFLKSWPIHSMSDTSEDPRKSPRKPPTAATRPSSFIIKYSFFVSMTNSSYLKFSKKIPGFAAIFTFLNPNTFPLSWCFFINTSKLVVLQGFMHLVELSAEVKVSLSCLNIIVQFSSI